MRHFRFIFPVIALIAICSNAWSQIVFWEASLKDTSKGDVIIKLADITGIALHTYKLNGAIEITECTVDTKGNHSFRFYAMVDDNSEQMKAVRTALGEVKKINHEKTDLPARKFPEGAYSHNVEYQLNSPAKVRRVYASLKKVWHCPKSTEHIDSID